MGSTDRTTEPPTPAGVRSYDDLAERLRDLRAWAGISYRELHRRVLALRRQRGVAELPSPDTVHRCLQPGRRRVDVELVVDIADVLLAGAGDSTPWRQACAAAAGLATEASVVSIADSLPERNADFVGRERQLEQLTRLLHDRDRARNRDRNRDCDRDRDRDRARPIVVGLDGMPGVGKTQLAIHASGSIVRELEPDLVLWVNLRGHDPHRPPVAPTAVLDGFLRRLGVPGSQIGGLDPDQRSARFRELATARRLLLVLDDAADEHQVRPLLPDAPDSVTLITSRSFLAGLGPDRLALGSFDQAESIALLAGVIGTERVAAEPDAAARIAELVGHLPLALGIEAARILQAADWTLADHLDRLRDRHARLLLPDGVQLALDASYDALPAQTRRLFRLIALHPGEDIDEYAAAALADVDPDTAARMLRDLTDASLLHLTVPRRHRPHDLVRLFAANRVADHEPRTARRAAIVRLRDYYRYAAMLAMDEYAPDVAQRPRFEDPGCATPKFPDQNAARCWLDAERSNLVAIASSAAADTDARGDARDGAGAGADGAGAGVGADNQACTIPIDLSETLYRYFDFTALHSEALVLHQVACDATEGNRQGNALRFLASTKEELGSYDEALELLSRSAAIHHEFGDVVAEASVLCNSGITTFKAGRQAEAVRLLERARAIYRDAENPAGEAIALANLGTIYGKWQRADEALRCSREALELAHQLGFRGMEAFVRGTIGSVHAGQGEHLEALAQYRQAVRIAEELGTHTVDSTMRNKMGLSHRALGEPETAISLHRSALESAQRTGELSEQAVAYDGLAECAQDLDRPSDAGRYREQARRIRVRLGVVEPPALAIPGGSTSNDEDRPVDHDG